MLSEHHQWFPFSKYVSVIANRSTKESEDAERLFNQRPPEPDLTKPQAECLWLLFRVYPNVAKVGGHQSQGVWGWSRSSLLRTLSNVESEVLRLSLRVNNMAKWTHLSNSTMGVSKKQSVYYDIGNNYGPLSTFCYVVYATKGFTTLGPQSRQMPRRFIWRSTHHPEKWFVR
jgi:hypothetical protein